MYPGKATPAESMLAAKIWLHDTLMLMLNYNVKAGAKLMIVPDIILCFLLFLLSTVFGYESCGCQEIRKQIWAMICLQEKQK